MIGRLLESRVCALLFTAFIALVWLNQSVGGRDWESLRDQIDAHPGEHAVARLFYPFTFLYRRAPDEALYFATASATLGKPYDPEIGGLRGDTPLPPLSTPSDGHFHLPYAEVPFEYPPPNVPFVLAPRLVAWSFAGYSRVFGALMGLLLLAAAWLAARLGAGAKTSADGRAAPWSGDSESARIFAFGLLLLAHGSIAIQRLDALVALLAIVMVQAAVRGQDSRLGVFAGLIGATKFVPILLLPAIVIASGIRAPRRLLAIGGATAIGVLVGLGPMLVLGRASLPLLLAYHSARGLHVESTLGVVYGAVKAISGSPESTLLDYGSYNFHGPLSELLAKASTLVTLGLVALVGVMARPRADGDRTRRIVLAALGSTLALWLGGKVFSPQYLTWALPLVIAVPGRLWRRLAFGLGIVLVLSQVYLRGYYDFVYHQWPLGVATMVVRLAALVALFWFVLRELRISARESVAARS